MDEMITLKCILKKYGYESYRLVSWGPMTESLEHDNQTLNSTIRGGSRYCLNSCQHLTKDPAP